MKNPSFLTELTTVKSLVYYYCSDSKKKSYLQLCWKQFSSLCEIDLAKVKTLQQRVQIVDDTCRSLQVLTQAMCSASKEEGREMVVLREWAWQFNKLVSPVEYRRTKCIEYVKSFAQSVKALFTGQALLKATPDTGVIFDKLCSN